MTLVDLMRKRASIRDYSEKPIENDKLNKILEAAQLAPSACNFQPWYFIVVSEKEGLNNIYDCYSRDWVKTSPMFIIVCGNSEASWKRPADGKDHVDIDAGIAIEHICLAAVEENIGTCIICHFDVKLCKESFGIPEQIEPLAIISIGYPSDPNIFEKTLKKRKAIEEIVRREKF